MKDGESREAATASVPKNRQPGVREVPRIRRVLAGAVAITISLLLAFAILEFGVARFFYTNEPELREDECDP